MATAAPAGIATVKKFLDKDTAFFVVDDTQRPHALVPTSTPTLKEFASDWKREDLSGDELAAWHVERQKLVDGIADGTFTYVAPPAV